MKFKSAVVGRTTRSSEEERGEEREEGTVQRRTSGDTSNAT